MRNLTELNKWRVPLPDVYKGIKYDERYNGAFVIEVEQPDRGRSICLHIIAASGGGWDHVSVSLVDRTPTWEEMELVKKLFFKEHETAMQLHVPGKDHINVHTFCLHLWRPHRLLIPTPPKDMV